MGISRSNVGSDGGALSGNMAWLDSRSRVAWWAVAFVFGAITAWVVLTYVGTFVLGLFLYYVARPAYSRFRTQFRRSIAAATALLALAVPVVLLVGYTLAVAAQELARLQRTVDLGPLSDQIEPYLDVSQVVQDPEMLLQNPDIVNAGQLVAEGALGYIPLVGTALINVFLALAVAFYLLRDGPRLGRWVRETFDDQEEFMGVYLDAVDEDLGSVYFGNILNAFAIVVVAAFVYTVLNVFAPAEGIPYPALVAVLAGAASLIPVVGMKLVYVPLSLGLFARAALTGEPLWFPTVFVVATVVFVDFIPDLVLRPYVSGRNLHVGLVMIAYIIGPLLFGWYGLFLGPLLLVVVYHFARLVLPVLIDGDGVEAMPVTEDAVETGDSADPGETDDAVDGDPA
ncbi:AI-2E family transporter [Haloarcula sp. S1CR25-12]|uniref:AI-2E family transporter n=1 Tax=Haloarcula saliterrae TaxID=2950534 RepID=A0ABU2F9I9_9EURY|nr:AI-2E family transporter [Haloarcula sp. S1CR25-12]MDS0258947.1 AI-2E family transporter [Haloarcula sp. S1CR25-12]